MQEARAQKASARQESAHPVCFSAAHPKLAAELSRGVMAALRGRRSAVGLAFADTNLRVTCKVNRTGHFYAASAIKATIISALLRKIGGSSHLTGAQRSLAWSMITESNNNSATRLWNEVGISGVQRFLDLAGMTHTELSSAWGLSQITAQDELVLLRVLTSAGKVLSTASRRYVLWLMAHVVSAQRWGVSAGAPANVTVHIKNGWLPYPTGSNWRINSIGAFTGPGINYLMAALTSQNPSMGYGIDTIEAAARVINRDLAEFRVH
jgi:beta-lactamase class A